MGLRILSVLFYLFYYDSEQLLSDLGRFPALSEE